MKSKPSILLILLGILLLCWQACAPEKTLRYQATGLNGHLSEPLPSLFTDYIVQTNSMIQKARFKAQVDSRAQVVNDNSPFLYLPDPKKCKPNKNGRYDKSILLIHGFLDSPYSLQTLGKHLSEQCVVAASILLPGHGTTPGDLLQVSYQDWVNIVDYGVNQLAKSADHVFLMGYSLGGLLAVNEALDHPEKISRIILFAPVLKLKFAYSYLILPYSILARGIPSLEWISRHTDIAETRYESFPIAPVNEIVKLINLTLKKLAKIRRN